MEFQKLKEDDDQRASFMAAVEALCIPTQDASVRRLFMALQWTLENCWAHPTLVSMMKGEEIEETKGMSCHGDVLSLSCVILEFIEYILCN